MATSVSALDCDDPNFPLAGCRVVEFGQYIAIPAAGQMLRDLGAEVIKVEPASGDPARSVGWSQDNFGPMFVAYNRGKRSVVLDLKTVSGRSHARQLALQADVVLPTADGAVVLTAFLEPHFARLAEAIGHPEILLDPRFSTNAARVQHRAELRRLLSEIFHNYTSQALCERVGQAGVVIAAVRNFDQVRTSENSLTSSLFVALGTPTNPCVEVPGQPFQFDGGSSAPTALPAVGEHTDEILRALH